MPRLLSLAALFAIVAGTSFTYPLHAAEPKLKAGDFVAVIGDSITEQKLYSVYIEDYLLMCQPEKVRVTQFGWGGETAVGFERRMVNDLLRFKPNVATTCFGMNDGGYSPMNPDKAKGYREYQTKIVKKCKEAGVRTIVVGSPGVVDADTFKRDKPGESAMYNKTLGEERDISREVAAAEGVAFADVYGDMMDVMTKAKTKYGKGYAVAGGDGVHPGPNGHLVMAYAFLKALGCDGEIGKIRVDLAGDKAEASEGHKVKSSSKGVVELESTRYPFCFFGDPTKSEATAGIIEFFPFNGDLNRLTLTVSGATAENYNVTWGKTTKKFTGKQLTDGINLAAEFLDNPFSEPFAKVEQKVKEQQNFETPLIKNLVTKLPEFKSMSPTDADALDLVATHAMQRDDVLAKASSEAIKPVTHTIKIEVAK